MAIIKTLLIKIKKISKFYCDALKNIDKEYNLVLEKIIFSPKFKQKVPVIRLLGCGGYIIETAQSIINHENYKCHLHPDDLLKINKLAIEDNNNKIVQQDVSGEIYLSDGTSFNIHDQNLNNINTKKLFSLPNSDIIRLLESRGFKLGRNVSHEISKLKQQSISRKISQIKIIK